MLDQKNLFELAKITAKANAASPVAYSFGDNKFSYAELNDTLRNELNEYAATPALYRENKNMIFSLMEVIFDEALPVKVMSMYEQFAEVKQFAQGEKAVYVQRITEASRKRAKQFITKVGLAGRYEVFKLDGRKFELETTAYGGAAQVSIEEFLDGRLDLAELVNIVMEGLTEKIYEEIALSLKDAVAGIKGLRAHAQAGFNDPAMTQLLTIASAYGAPTIYCTQEFAATMLPADTAMSDNMKNELWAKGYFATFRGYPVVILPQSIEEKNGTFVKVVDPSIAYIIPTGSEKPVKIAFEGQTLVREVENEDWSKEIQVYKKLGVGTIVSEGICTYTNTSLVTDFTTEWN